MTWLVAYDIANVKRIQRVHRQMRRHAMPIEHSVFWLEGGEAQRRCCLDHVLPLLHRTEDDLRCYAMPERGLRLHLGAPALPQGIVWTALPGARWSSSLDDALRAGSCVDVNSAVGGESADAAGAAGAGSE